MKEFHIQSVEQIIKNKMLKIEIPNLTNFYCNGSLYNVFQYHELNFAVDNYLLVNKIRIIPLNVYADDYPRMIVNNSIDLLPTDLHWVDYGYGAGFIGSVLPIYEDSITLTSNNLNVKIGTINTIPSSCSFRGGFTIELWHE